MSYRTRLGVTFIRCDGCPAIVPGRSEPPEWYTWRIPGVVRKHLCPRCLREGREAA